MSLVPFSHPKYDAVKRLARMSTIPPKQFPNGNKVAPPITGVFGWLPAELVDQVAAAVLRIDPGRFNAFTCTCKGVRRSVSYAQVAEFLIRTISYMIPAPDLLRKPCAYTEHLKLKMRNRYDLCALSSLMQYGAAHCASPNQACCRDLRDRFHRQNEQHGAKLVPHTLMSEALKGVTAWRADVAAPSNAHILCTVPGGAAILEGDAVKLVWARHADVFAPGHELASLPLMTFPESEWPSWDVPWPVGVWAAAEGDRVAVCTISNCTTRADYPCSRHRVHLTVWAEHGQRKLYTLAHPVVMPRKTSSPCVAAMWMHNGDVWFLFTCTCGAFDEELKFIRFRDGESEPLVRSMLRKQIYSVRVSTRSGRVVFLEYDGEMQTDRVILFDSEDVSVFTITDPFTVSESSGHCNELAISPNGRVIVMLLRDQYTDSGFRGDPEIVVYHCDAGVHSWKFRMAQAMVYSATYAWTWGALKGSRVSDMVFSPSGDTLLILFNFDDDDEEDWLGGTVAINVDEALRTGSVVMQGCSARRNNMPSQLFWQDGIFLRTCEEGGVLRVGVMP